MGILNGKVAIVTGAGTGLGKEVAQLLVAEGAKITVCGRREKKIQELLEGLEPYKDQICALTADVSNEQEVDQLIQQTIERFGKVDILINNAAVFENTLVAETTFDSWNYHFRNNVSSAFLMSRACIPIMRAQRSGQIINLTSSIATTGAAGFGAYGASKAAIEILSHTLDEEEGRNGIIVSVVNPGVMKTDMHARGSDPKKVARNLLRYIQEQRSYGNKVVQLDQLYEVEYYI